MSSDVSGNMSNRMSGQASSRVSAPLSDAIAFRRSLAREAAEWYRPSGLFARKFAAGKLGGDPVYLGIVERALIPDDSRILDLGCGQGLMLAWLLASRGRHERAEWPAALPEPPRVRSFHGIELMQSDVDRARTAFAGRGSFVAGDIRTADYGEADIAIILDVLHYMDVAEQCRVLERVRDALRPAQGTLLLRVGDASGGLGFHFSRWVDWTVTFIRGHRLPALHCRPLDDWKALLRSLDFTVDAYPMSTGTPFANVLLVARLKQ